MKHVKAMTCATAALLVLVGCGAGDADRSTEDARVDAGKSPASIANSAGPAGADAAISRAEVEPATGVELARIEFTDGSVVRFEEIDGGVLVSELRSELNPRRLIPEKGMTALRAFERLAPGHTIPAALLRAHERMYPEGRPVAGDPRIRGAADGTAGVESLPTDPDLEHNGEFQQSYPAANFLAVMCDFPLGGGSYKHTNRTPHNDVSLNVHSTYFAVGSDNGIITAQPCAGKNAGGFFDGQCGATITVNAGFHSSGFYDAGAAFVCDKKAGGVQLCFPNLKRFELRYGKISASVNFHDCAQISAVLTD